MNVMRTKPRERSSLRANTTIATASNFFDIFTGQKLAVIAILTYLIILVTVVYGPIAAMLVELYPTRIRYSGLSLPYHIGNGWFGGLMPATAFAISAQSGNLKDFGSNDQPGRQRVHPASCVLPAVSS